MMNTNIKNERQMIIIPELNKQKVLAAEKIGSMSAGLTTLTFVLVHRAQISASLITLKKQDIQQLPSVKWNARLISKCPIIRRTIIKIVIAETINYELDEFVGLNPDQISNRLNETIDDLSQTVPTSGMRILPTRAINKTNLKSHRLAYIAKLVGIFQAKPLFEPGILIKNTSIILLSFEELAKLIIKMHENMQIPFDERIANALMTGNETTLTEAIKEIINEEIFNNQVDDINNNIRFEDAIDLNTSDNKTMLEQMFPISRSKPTEINEKSPLPENYLTNPLFAYAVSINEKQISETKKVSKTTNATSKSAKPSPKRKAPAKPKPKAE
uniref:Uncharacterized protein n=1 Tax=Euglena anabaena TaxID=38273 RepID=A0A0G3F9C3_EUGAN|nr:hypothetical protein [Euglenaria anabaena]AKJ83320.1 hypothetical protein [Euglenaria anabaena]